jgi:tripartite-type tricarboxylate transporter receptor subunit TctC
MKKGVSKKWVLLGLFVTFIFVAAPLVRAEVMKPLADGFPKRAITIVVVDDPGSRDDLYAKSLQQALVGISPVPVVVADEPVASGGNFDKMKELISRAGGNEGYFPMVISSFGPASDVLVSPIKKDLDMDLDDMNIVIRTEVQEKILVQRKGAPYGPTFAGMMKWGKENPGKLRYISREVGSGFDIYMEMILADLGVKVEKIPGGSHDSIVATVGAGQGDFALTTAQAAKTSWEAGKVFVSMVTGSKVTPPWDKDPNCVSSDKAGLRKITMGTIMGLAVTKHVPKEHVNWLYQLFKAATATDIYKNREKMIPATTIEVWGPEQANKEARDLRDMADPIVRALGMHWEQQK